MGAFQPPTPSEGRRPRRGSLERPVSGRLYRVSWALVAVPLLIAAFTVVRPAPLAKPELPPSFDGRAATRLADQLALGFPDRTPGSDEAVAAADWVAERLAEYNLAVERRHFTADIPDLGTVRLTNIVAGPLRIAPERSPDTIVIMAHRDNTGLTPGANDNASGTAALIELARNLSTLSLSHTIVFVSTDGGSFGNHGAARLAADPEFRRDILAVVNLDSVAGPGAPRLVFAGDEPRSPAGVLLTTAEASLEAETGEPPLHAAPFEQLGDLAFPFDLHDQAPFLGQRVSAVTLTASGDRVTSPDEQTFDSETLGAIGRAAQALVVSLDGAAEVARGTDSFLYLGGRFIRGFAIQLALLLALVPILVTLADLYARLRRRGAVLGPAGRSYGARLLVWLWAGLVAALFSFAGLFPGVTRDRCRRSRRAPVTGRSGPSPASCCSSPRCGSSPAPA